MSDALNPLAVILAAEKALEPALKEAKYLVNHGGRHDTKLGQIFWGYNQEIHNIVIGNGNNRSLSLGDRSKLIVLRLKELKREIRYLVNSDSPLKHTLLIDKIEAIIKYCGKINDPQKIAAYFSGNTPNARFYCGIPVTNLTTPATFLKKAPIGFFVTNEIAKTKIFCDKGEYKAASTNLLKTGMVVTLTNPSFWSRIGATRVASFIRGGNILAIPILAYHLGKHGDVYMERFHEAGLSLDLGIASEGAYTLGTLAHTYSVNAFANFVDFSCDAMTAPFENFQFEIQEGYIKVYKYDDDNQLVAVRNQPIYVYTSYKRDGTCAVKASFEYNPTLLELDGIYNDKAYPIKDYHTHLEAHIDNQDYQIFFYEDKLVPEDVFYKKSLSLVKERLLQRDLGHYPLLKYKENTVVFAQLIDMPYKFTDGYFVAANEIVHFNENSVFIGTEEAYRHIENSINAPVFSCNIIRAVKINESYEFIFTPLQDNAIIYFENYNQATILWKKDHHEWYHYSDRDIFAAENKIRVQNMEAARNKRYQMLQGMTASQTSANTLALGLK